MTHEDVIKVRDTLKAGKNLPVRVCIDNVFAIIDECSPTQFVIWDDENGILYAYRMVDMQTDKIPSNIEQAVSLFAVPYESIQAIEVPVLPIEYLPNSIQSIRDTGREIRTEYEKTIINTYNKVLNPDLVNLSHEDINKVSGNKLNTNDDYYNGKFTESFKETVAVNRYNESLKKDEESED